MLSINSVKKSILFRSALYKIFRVETRTVELALLSYHHPNSFFVNDDVLLNLRF